MGERQRDMGLADAARAGRREGQGREGEGQVAGARRTRREWGRWRPGTGAEPRCGRGLVKTGQNYGRAMAGGFFDELALPVPDYNREVGSGTHAVQTAHVMMKFEQVCLETRPERVIVVGGVNSTMAAAIA
mgnify:CR=1 FL=1